MMILKIKEHSILLDDEDYYRISTFTCNVHFDNLTRKFDGIQTYYKNKVTNIGKVVLKYEGPLILDHKDRDIFNNQKENLRLITKEQSQLNTSNRNNSLSKYKGVSWCSQLKKWRVRCQIRGFRKQIGYYVSEEEAALAYNKVAIKFHKEFAVLNIIKT